MDDSKIYEITIHRLQRWSHKLRVEHSTPAILIGIGHDHKSGQITVCVPEDFNDYEIKGILQVARQHLDKEEPYR